MAFTVNAGFSRLLKEFVIRGGRKCRHEWKNVQGIVIDLPDNMYGTPECFLEIQKHAPEGEGWRVDGFCRTTPKKMENQT